MLDDVLKSFGIRDYSPDGSVHVSPETRRAQLAGIYELCATPIVSDHLHFGVDLLLLTHGTLHILIGQDQLIELEAGQIFIIPGGNRHRARIPENAHVCFYDMEIVADFFRTLARAPESNPIAERLLDFNHPFPVRVINDPAAFQSLRSLFEEMVTVNRDITNPDRILTLKTFHELMALYVVKLLRDDASRLPEHPTIQRILEVQAWLDRHFAEPITRAEMAQMASLSEQHFSALFNKVIGMSPKAYLQARRLKHATDLLAHSTLPITHISQRVGFNSLANFTSSFTRFAGLTPSDYRKRSQQD